MGSRTNDPEGMRRRIVEAAFQAFTRDGYGVTAVHDLRVRAGVTGGALAHHFPSKKALGLSVIRDRVAAAVEETWIAPLASAPDARTGILLSLDRVIADLQGQAIAGCPLTNLTVELAGQDADLREAADAVFARWRGAIAEKVRTDLGARQRPVGDPVSVASLVVAAITGSLVMAKAAQDVAPLQRCRDELSTLLA